MHTTKDWTERSHLRGRSGVWEITLFSVSSQIYDHLCVWKFHLNSKLPGDKDCLHWIWPDKKWLLFLLPFHSCVPCRAHQTRRSGRNSRPISAEIALPRLQSEIKVPMFLFASHSFLANNLRFMVKLIVKTIVINGKIHKNKKEKFYSSNKEGLICWYRSITANLCKFVLTKFQVNIKSKS